MKHTLHIVSTNFTADLIRGSVACPSDAVLVWRDSLVVGPVSDPRLEKLSTIRHQYFAGSDRAKFSRIDWVSSFSERDSRFRRCDEWQQVILWFGPHAEEQLLLVQILASLQEQPWINVAAAIVSCPTAVIAAWPIEHLCEFYKQRLDVTEDLKQFSATVWRLYCQQDPQELDIFTKTNSSRYYDVCAAFRAVLGEFPSVSNGLSKLEAALLSNVPTCVDIDRIKTFAVHVPEESGFCYELPLERLWTFLTSEVPLIEPVEGADVPVSFEEFVALRVRLTPAAQQILEQQADYVALCGIDRWIGGVHLKGKTAKWRWDEDNEKVQEC